MKLILAIALILSISHFLDLPNFLAGLAKKTQTICQEMTPTFSKEKGTIASLVCGEKVLDPNYYLALQVTGLIHIFVVSAGQLVVISEILIFLGWSRFFLFFVLLCFTLMTGLQAPCVRSLIGWSLGFFLVEKKLFLTGPQTVFFTGVFTLALFPDWCQSFSLQLSWAAALALALAATFKNKNHSSVQHLLVTSGWVFLILLPLLQSMGGAHPLSILWNVTLGTLTAFFLFPLCILAFINSFFLSVLETVMTFFWASLNLGHQFQFEAIKEPPSYLKGWLWILSLHFILQFSGLFYQRTYKT